MEVNRPNNEEQQKHVSTRADHWTNATAETPSALDVVYYDDRIKLVFSPELPIAQQTESRKFDYEHQVVTYVTRVKAQELCDAFDKQIVKAIAEGRKEEISVPIAGVHQLMITTDPDVEGVPHPKLKFIKNIDPNTLTASDDNIIFYEFNSSEYILGYNNVTGEFKERVITFSELKLFINDLENFVDASSNSYVHADRVVNRYWKDTIDDKLNKIGGANGLSLAYKPRNATQGSIFSAKPSPDSATQTTTISSIDDLENELPFN